MLYKLRFLSVICLSKLTHEENCKDNWFLKEYFLKLFLIFKNKRINDSGLLNQLMIH